MNKITNLTISQGTVTTATTHDHVLDMLNYATRPKLQIVDRQYPDTPEECTALKLKGYRLSQADDTCWLLYKEMK